MSNKYIFFATAWSAVNGGINSFNFDLCTAIGTVGQSINVFIENGEKKILKPDLSPHISIHELPTKFENFDDRSIKIISEVVGDCSKAIWIGHDAVSGGAAIFSRNKLGGRSAVFHHMDYSNYYYLKQKDADQKIQLQKHLLKTADIVLALGPDCFKMRDIFVLAILKLMKLCLVRRKRQSNR